MKVTPPFLLVFFFLMSGINPLLATPSCHSIHDNRQNCSGTETKTVPSALEEKARIRSLRRQHTREAYIRNDMTPTSFSGDNLHRYRKSKKMTIDERMRLRQQIDEVGQSIYHQ